MTPLSIAERLIYAVVIILSVIVLAITVVSPPDLMKNKVIYQGF